MTWAWLDPPVVDFGAPPDVEDDPDTRTIWLHADPYRVLGVSRNADAAEVRKAYRRLMLVYHPDVNAGEADPLGRFEEIRNAFEAINGEPHVDIQPPVGEWWQVAGLWQPDPWHQPESAVVGITFEARRSRIGDGPGEVQIHYSGHVLSARVRQTRGGLRRAAAALAESIALVLTCLALIPVVAIPLALDVFLLSDGDPFVTWGVAVLILCAGYGALVAVLTNTGHRPPSMRRALGTARDAVGELAPIFRPRRHRRGRGR